MASILSEWPQYSKSNLVDNCTSSVSKDAMNSMRTTINLDKDVHELASLYAKNRGITLGAAIGELVRKGLVATSSAPSPRLNRLSNGLLAFPSRGRTITSEMVKAALAK